MALKRLELWVRELLDICGHKKYIVEWWEKMLFSYFLWLNYHKRITWYCDMSKSDWNIYKQLWFKFKRRTKPTCHKRKIWDDKYVDIYDSWLSIYVW